MIRFMRAKRRGEYLLCASFGLRTILYEIYNRDGRKIVDLIVWDDGKSLNLLNIKDDATDD